MKRLVGLCLTRCFPNTLYPKIIPFGWREKGKIQILFQSNHFLAEHLASIKLDISSVN